MTTNIPFENVNMVRTAAAKIIWDNLARVVANRDVSLATVRTAVMAVYGISWNRVVMTAITTNRINDVLATLKRYTPLPQKEYCRLSEFFKESYQASADFPPDLMEWHRLAQQLRLELLHGWDAILATAIFLRSHEIVSPSNLGVLSPGDFQPLSEAAPHPQLLRALWCVARSDDAFPSSAHTYLLPPHPAVNKDSLTKAVKAHTSKLQRTGKLVMRTTRKLHLPKDFGKLGPAQRIKTLKAAALNPRVLDRFVFDATSANLLKQVKGSLPGMASAYRCYISFCELRNFTPFPAKEEVATQRSSVFGNTSTYGSYVCHLEKCCYFLRYPTT